MTSIDHSDTAFDNATEQSTRIGVRALKGGAFADSDVHTILSEEAGLKLFCVEEFHDLISLLSAAILAVV